MNDQTTQGQTVPLEPVVGLRSPMRDPRPGDLVKRMGRVRRVTARSEFKVWFRAEGQANAHEKSLMLCQWVEWAKRAEAVTPNAEINAEITGG